MAYDTMKAHDHICQRDRSSSVLSALPHKMHALATTLLCDFEHSNAISLRQLRAVHPKSSGLQAGIASRSSSLSSALRLSPIVGGMRHSKASPLVLAQLTQTSCLAQHCMLVLVVMNACVNARNHHRHSRNFEDVCWGAFAYWSPLHWHSLMHCKVYVLVAARETGLSTISGSLPPRLIFDTCPTFVQRHAWWAVSSEDCAISTNCRTHTSDVETSAGWCAVARSPRGDVMFGPVITTEAHVACAGACRQTNNTAEASTKHFSSSCRWGLFRLIPVRVSSSIHSMPLMYVFDPFSTNQRPVGWDQPTTCITGSSTFFFYFAPRLWPQRKCGQ